MTDLKLSDNSIIDAQPTGINGVPDTVDLMIADKNKVILVSLTQSDIVMLGEMVGLYFSDPEV